MHSFEKTTRRFQYFASRLRHCSRLRRGALRAGIGRRSPGQHFATNVIGDPVTGVPPGSGFAGARFSRFAPNHDSYDGDRCWNSDNCFPTEPGGCNWCILVSKTFVRNIETLSDAGQLSNCQGTTTGRPSLGVPGLCVAAHVEDRLQDRAKKLITLIVRPYEPLDPIGSVETRRPNHKPKAQRRSGSRP